LFVIFATRYLSLPSAIEIFFDVSFFKKIMIKIFSLFLADLNVLYRLFMYIRLKRLCSGFLNNLLRKVKCKS